MVKIGKLGRGAKFAAMVSLTGGLALGGYGIASATTPSSSLVSSTLTSNASSNTALPRPMRVGMPGGGTIQSVTATSLVVQRPDGSTTTYTLNSSTTYQKGQSATTFSALSQGDRVAVRVSAQGSTVATSVRILEPMIGGTIQSISGTQIVVADQQGFWRTIDLSSSTTYEKAGATVSLSALKVGDTVTATGTIASDHTTLNADSVTVQLPHFAGKVTSVTGDTITIARPDGTTSTITVTSSTTYLSGGSSSSLSAVAVGSFVDAEGAVTGTNAMTASIIHVSNGGPQGGPHQGPGGGPQGGPGGPGVGL